MAASAFVFFIVFGCMGSLFLASLVGWQLGKKHEGDALGNLGAMRSVVFSIFGLLVAFAFNGAVASYEERQRAIREEGETVQAAYNLLPGLPKKFREAIEPMFESYQDLRNQSYRIRESYDGLDELHRITDRVEDRIWSAALKASLDPATNELGPALRLRVADMQKARVEQEIVSRSHPPFEGFLFLGVISLFTSFYVGYGMSGHTRWGRSHLLAYSVLMGGIFYLIIDFEYPRLGLIHDHSPRETLKQRSIEIDLDSPQFGGDSRSPLPTSEEPSPAPPSEAAENPEANGAG